MLRLFILSVATVAALLVLAGYAGTLHRAADTVALGRPVFALGALAGIVTARRRILRAGFAAVGLVALLSVAIPLVPQRPGGDLRVYSKNLLASNGDLAPLVADIAAQQVDAVFLQELSERNAPILDMLAAEFPHQHLCRYSGWSGIAIASRLPFDGPAECSAGRALATAPVSLDGRKLWLVSAHIPWPWPYENAWAERAAQDLLADLDAPAVIAGDFNAFPWTGRVQRLARASGTRLAGPVRPTYHLRILPFPIDHALAPGGGRIERRPRLGSDHFGIVADLSLGR